MKLKAMPRTFDILGAKFHDTMASVKLSKTINLLK